MVAIEGVLLIIGAVGGFVSILFSNMRKSRCTHITLCRCVSCRRELMSKSMMELDSKADPKGAGDAL